MMRLTQHVHSGCSRDITALPPEPCDCSDRLYCDVLMLCVEHAGTYIVQEHVRLCVETTSRLLKIAG